VVWEKTENLVLSTAPEKRQDTAPTLNQRAWDIASDVHRKKGDNATGKSRISLDHQRNALQNTKLWGKGKKEKLNKGERHHRNAHCL